jgi:hypothetical protein
MRQQKALRDLKKGWVVSLIALLVITFNGSVVRAQSIKPGHQKMEYSVYAGGIHALDATLDINLTKKERFNIELFAHHLTNEDALTQADTLVPDNRAYQLRPRTIGLNIGYQF